MAAHRVALRHSQEADGCRWWMACRETEVRLEGRRRRRRRRTAASFKGSSGVDNEPEMALDFCGCLILSLSTSHKKTEIRKFPEVQISFLGFSVSKYRFIITVLLTGAKACNWPKGHATVRGPLLVGIY